LIRAPDVAQRTRVPPVQGCLRGGRGELDLGAQRALLLREEQPRARDRDQLVVRVRTGVLKLEPGGLTAEIVGLAEGRRRSVELDRQRVRAALEIHLRLVRGVGLAAPAVAEQHPRALPPVEPDPPGAPLGTLDVGTFAMRGRRAGREAVPPRSL